MLYVDTRQFDRVASEVLAAELLVDYTSLLGGEPYTISNTEQAKMWEGMLTKLHATQHGILYVSCAHRTASSHRPYPAFLQFSPRRPWPALGGPRSTQDSDGTRERRGDAGAEIGRRRDDCAEWGA